MKKFRDPKWETFSKCYEDSVKYRLTRRVMEHSHKSWFFEGWDNSSESSGWSTPRPSRNRIAPLSLPKQKISNPETKETSEDRETEGGGGETIVDAAPLADTSGPSEVDSPSEPGPADTTSSDGEPVIPPPRRRLRRRTPRSETPHRDSSLEEKPAVLRKPPRAKSSPALCSKESLRATGRLDWSEGQTEAGGRGTTPGEFQSSFTGHQRSEAVSPETLLSLIIKLRCAFRKRLPSSISLSHTSDACVQTTRQGSDKKNSNPERRRARSADLEKTRRSQLSVADDRWVTEYMRCFSARLRLCAFKTKLTIFKTDLTTKLLHFPKLRAFMTTSPGANITPVMTDFMTKLTDNFTDRFQGFSIPIEVLQFARDPFTIKPDADFCVKVKEVISCIDESLFQMELVDFPELPCVFRDFQRSCVSELQPQLLFELPAEILGTNYLSCHVCSETFRDPVSLGCSHSFCSSCLQKFWEQSKNKNCPICKRKSSKDLPIVNFTLKELADSFAERQKAGSSETEKGEKKVGVVCSKHPEEPRLFCKDEERAVCPVCEFSLHHSHKVVPVEQAVSELKDLLKSDLETRGTIQRSEETYKEVIQVSEKQLLSTERQIRAEFIKLHQFLKEEEESRLAALREEEELKGKTISREMKSIQEHISSLSHSISAVEEELQKHNGPFLSSYKATQSRARVQSALSDPQPLSGALTDVAKHLGNLSFRVWEKMKDQVHFSPVILDPNTAHSCLSLSDDLTSVRQGGEDQQLPDNPERSTKYPTVLGSEGFSSGRHSWEVEVGDHPDWLIGLTKESVDRKGDIPASPEYGIWCVIHLSGKYTNGAGETVRVKKNLQRIRVQLDYDRGEVSFYDPEDMTPICTHRDTFTEELFPYFSIGAAGDAKTADIQICQSEIPL
ncbi:hypothetical protein F7725_006086 [Dissostichus mawsoni]|uniref:Uncharacterized protein n=1 Tax=Dissostichus mawsoni TaxID=36200 RepID=A0A7J5YV74_DISMA|nr:hypothetical protein F7725_006086 [Dissostichus mawsoni]